MNKTIWASTILGIAFLSGCGGEQAPDPVVLPAPQAPQPPATKLAPLPAEGAVAASEYRMAEKAPKAGACSLDAINGQRASSVSMPAKGAALMGGWAASSEKKPPANALFVLRGTAASYSVPLVTGGERPDVARALGSDALRTAGFNLRVALAGIPAGSYQLVIVMDPASSKYCDLKATLVLG